MSTYQPTRIEFALKLVEDPSSFIISIQRHEDSLSFSFYTSDDSYIFNSWPISFKKRNNLIQAICSTIDALFDLISCNVEIENPIVTTKNLSALKNFIRKELAEKDWVSLDSLFETA